MDPDLERQMVKANLRNARIQMLLAVIHADQTDHAHGCDQGSQAATDAWAEIERLIKAGKDDGI